VDSSSERGRARVGFFEGLYSPQQYVKRASSSSWVNLTPTTTSAHATTTITLTSTAVTCTAVGGPAYIPYVSGFPQGGALTSVRPMRPAVMLQSVELSGSFPRAWAGSVNHHAQSGNFEAIWGDASTRSSRPPKFDRGQVVSRQTDRAVGPGASSEHYLSHSQGVGPAAVAWPDVVSHGGYGARPKTTGSARQMESGSGIPSRNSSTTEGGPVQPVNLGQPSLPSGVHVL